MKKKNITIFLAMTMIAILTGCGITQSSIEKSKSEEYNLTNVNYTTITEGFDWGPAITKVILDMKATIESSALTEDTFKVNSVREYKAGNLETMKIDEELTVETKERKIVAVYVSDENGEETEKGTFVTIDMEVGPDLPESSPFYYNYLTNHNVYVDTSYMIELADEASLKTKDGQSVTMTETDKVGYKGNMNVIADEFNLAGSYTNGNISLKYASFIPKTASDKDGSNPLIIWLHGVGEGGEDPMIALYGNKVVNLATEEIQSYFGETGAYLLVPQCTTMWMDYDGTSTYNNTVEGSEGKSYYTETLMGLIDDYVMTHPEINKNRIYIGGCSNGGYMTMNLITTYPDYFAAAFPICEAYSKEWLTQEKIANIVNIPIWFTHAKTDGTVPIYEGEMDYATMNYQFTLDENEEAIATDEFTNAAYNSLVKAGAKNTHYTLWENVVDTSGKYFKTNSTTEPYEYFGHFSWIYTLNNECTEQIDGKEITIFEWLAKQSK